MPKFINSNATFWVIFKQCGAAPRSAAFQCSDNTKALDNDTKSIPILEHRELRTVLKIGSYLLITYRITDIIKEQRIPLTYAGMVVIIIKLHLAFPSTKTPVADRPWVMPDKNEKTNEMIPSNDKIRKSVTSVLKVFRTHFKLRAFERTETELRATITQLNCRGNIFALKCEAPEASKVNDAWERILGSASRERKRATFILTYVITVLEN